MNQTTDHHFITQTLAGDPQAFGQLVMRYQDYVFTVVNRMVQHREEAQEITQDTFVKAYGSLSSFRGDSKFSSWLYTIAYRKTLDRIKKNKRYAEFDALEQVLSADEDTETHGLKRLVAQERSATIKAAIAQLEPVTAALISFYYYEELSVKEIEKITDLTPDNIKVKLYRGRKKLFQLLQQAQFPEIQHGYGNL
ncbi:RNA polymerase sigma factor [Gilvibacter sp. SZ-19]|uniref:RNA polymerase sigma factor n=1 Tax=unclassified Gilvibacter TaxID=2625242 RepID=UPI000B3CE6EE|nr:RNA polymerase sigma factor [Gilvibacter sp. SZ-19]ARV12782.1 RNA polymerase [Gilvibacter sp. SZ-19]